MKLQAFPYFRHISCVQELVVGIATCVLGALEVKNYGVLYHWWETSMVCRMELVATGCLHVATLELVVAMTSLDCWA